MVDTVRTIPLLSDHLAIDIQTQFITDCLTLNKVRCRDFRNFDEAKFVEAFQTTDICEKIKMAADCEEASTSLILATRAVCDQFAPMRSVRAFTSSVSKTKPFVTTELKKMFRKRDRALRALKLDYSTENLLFFKDVQKATSRKVKEEKKKYDTEKTNQILIKPRDVWKKLNDIVGWRGERHAPNIKASDYKDFQATLVNSVNTLIKVDTTPEEYQLADTSSTSHQLSLRQVTIDEVLTVLKSINHKKATGLDSINPRLLKAASEPLAAPLTDLFNRCIQENTFPTSFKSSRMTPVFKKGDKKVCSNYRPVSILNSMAIVFEKLIHSQLTDYLTVNNLYDDCQFGFRKGCNTSHAVSRIIDKISRSLEKGELCAIVAIDCNKAFDQVTHDQILLSLSKIRCDQKTIEFFSDYLRNRPSTVVVNNETATPFVATRGVPQGSVLGPTLFVTTVNLKESDIPADSYTQFADDVTVHDSAQNLTELVKLVTANVTKLVKFLKVRGLSLNFTKCNLCVFGNKRQLESVPRDLKIVIGDSEIERVETVCILGAKFDEELNFFKHWDSLITECQSKIRLLYRTASHLKQSLRLILSQALVYNRLTYLDWVFCGYISNTSLSARLSKLQKNLARWMVHGKKAFKHAFDNKKYPHVELSSLGWHPITKKFEAHLVAEVWKARVFKGVFPYFTVTPIDCKRQTRLSGSSGLYIEPCRTRARSQCAQIYGAKLFNSCPQARLATSPFEARSAYLERLETTDLP